MTIAITGAAGQLGRLAVEGLKARIGAAGLVGLVRAPDRARDLGIALREADYRRPETLGPALEGVGTLVLISSSDFDDRVGQHRAVIEAAKAAGVGRLVYTSVLKGDASPMLIARDHIATEAAIRASGLVATILRNGWYTENWTAGLPGALQAGALAGCAGQGLVSPATRADFAEAIVAVAAGTGHEGQVLELAGDEAFTLADLAAVLSRQTGREIPYADLPQADYQRMLEGIGLPAGLGALLADAEAQAARGALFDDSRTLSRLIGRPTTPLSVAVAAALA